MRIQCCQSPVPVPASVAMWVFVREQGPACQLRRVDSRRPQLHAVWLGRRLFCVGRVPPGVIRRVEKVCSLALELAQLHTCACAHCCVCHARAKVRRQGSRRRFSPWRLASLSPSPSPSHRRDGRVQSRPVFSLVDRTSAFSDANRLIYTDTVSHSCVMHMICEAVLR